MVSIYLDRTQLIHEMNKMAHIMDYILTNEDLKYNVTLEEVEQRFDYLEERFRSLEGNESITHIRINIYNTVFQLI